MGPRAGDGTLMTLPLQEGTARGISEGVGDRAAVACEVNRGQIEIFLTCGSSVHDQWMITVPGYSICTVCRASVIGEGT